MSKEDRYAHLGDEEQQTSDPEGADPATESESHESAETALSAPSSESNTPDMVDEIDGVSVYVDTETTDDRVRLHIDPAEVAPADVVAALEQVRETGSQAPLLTRHDARTIALASAVGASLGTLATTVALEKLRD